MDPIISFAKSKNIYVIEDCAQAHGAKYNGAHVGTIGDIGAWSFCQDKIMSTGGEGGMVATNSEELWEKCGLTKIMEKTSTQFTTQNIPQALGGYMTALVQTLGLPSFRLQ
jgi:dTDP-4-amino-4,6-dideoxygalactose transaminase